MGGITRVDFMLWRPGDLTAERFPNLKLVVCASPDYRARLTDPEINPSGQMHLDHHPSIEQVGLRGCVFEKDEIADFANRDRFPALREIQIRHGSMHEWKQRVAPESYQGHRWQQMVNE